MGGHCGTDVSGRDYEIEITRGVTFRAYGEAGMETSEVSVEEGVITMSERVPDEMNQWQARALAAMLIDAADELDEQEAGRKALGGEG